MSRYAKRVDVNQNEIVKALMQIGCTVADTSTAGGGFPDLVVGYRGVNYLLEVKDGNKKPSEQKLTPAQVRFHEKWKGQIGVINSVKGALDLVLNST